MSVWKKFTFPVAGIGAIVVAGMVSVAPEVNAQARRATCENYADDAVRQNEINERRNCGFQGPRWSDNRTAHFSWCMVFPRQAEREAEARREELETCRDSRRAEREGRRANCDTYAKIAVVQANANRKYNCGYRGGEWEREERPHFRWCMRARRSFLADELRFRTAELQKCFNKLGDDDEDSDDRGYKRRRFQ